jgi:GNAT superfamily N-acetyltransferase
MALSNPELLKELELGDADELVREAGWNQVPADWQIFFELGRVYAVRNITGRVIATAAILFHGGHFAWISMVLVAKDYRRQGLATLLLRRCVSDLIDRGLVPVVDATPAGRTVYVRLGFQDSWAFQRYSASTPRQDDVAPPKPNGIVIRPIRSDDWQPLYRYDARAFGADRTALLTRLRGRLPKAEFGAWREGQIVGFVLGRNGRSAAQLGPLVAVDECIAQALVGLALRHINSPIYVDVSDSKSALKQWLQNHGFAPQRPFMRMVYGSATRFDDSVLTMAVAGPELG